MKYREELENKVKETGNAAPVVRDNNGNVETDTKQVANIMAQYFSTVGQINNNAALERNKNKAKIGQCI